MPIQKTPGSEELLAQLMKTPTDRAAIEDLIQRKHYTPEEISRSGFDFAEKCFLEDLEYLDAHFEEYAQAEAKLIPGLTSAEMPSVFKILLKYGLDPNAFCENETVIESVAAVPNGYVAADTLALLLENGGDPFQTAGEESPFDAIDFKVIFDAIEMGNRMVYDAAVHCWFVLLGFTAGREEAKDRVDVFSVRRSECDLPPFELSDLKDHRNYTFAITNVAGRGENWSLHIIDKRTFWEVARL